MNTVRDFATEIERSRAALGTDHFDAVGRLRALEEQWARALLGLPDEGDLGEQVRGRVERGLDVALAMDAVAHLVEAERWQWEIGTWSTGSGEGLASMSEVYTLQAARAWLLAACGDVAGAGALVDGIERDPNGMGRYQAHVLLPLRARLGVPEPVRPAK